ncbi:uncharacterized protein LOC135220068 [Macrobrachium nipponense]|uniref:uncharacterized protein LOC135220068 n=1 Tax=Macrobrachium nipponense TaxID=159736 RepID=UPI0030C7DE49
MVSPFSVDSTDSTVSLEPASTSQYAAPSQVGGTHYFRCFGVWIGQAATLQRVGVEGSLSWSEGIPGEDDDFLLKCKPSRVLKKDKLGSFVSQPLTPQSWQLHGHSFHHHKRLIGSELYGNSNTFSNNILKREATLGYRNLILKPVGSVINRGGFGVVKLGHFKGKCVAVKVLKGKRSAQSAVKEALLLKIRPQAHINSTYAVVTSSASKGFANIFWSRIIESSEEDIVPLKSVSSLFGLPIEDATSFHENQDCNGAIEWAWVVNELCAPHTLLTLINDPNIILTARDKVRFIGEIANGLAYLHSQDIVHLDVKPANYTSVTNWSCQALDLTDILAQYVLDPPVILGNIMSTRTY